MGIEVYINFDGNCREAVEYYAEVFKAERPQIMTFGEGHGEDGDWEIPEDAKDRVMHTELVISGSRVMFSDTVPGMPFKKGNNISLTYLSTIPDEIKRVFNEMKDDGQVGMELQETFWSKLYGSLTDKFGIEWQFSLENE
jgi:PhnB protein